jgi:hypothetical protein
MAVGAGRPTRDVTIGVGHSSSSGFSLRCMMERRPTKRPASSRFLLAYTSP